MKARVDLHLHSYWSDGELSPTKLVKECKKLGLEIISLTDHETTLGVEEAIRAGKKLDILIVPGVELSCDFLNQEQHLLGYFIDYQNPELNEFLKEVARKRQERFLKMIVKLKNLGFSLEYQEVKKYARGTLARPHLARTVIRNGKNSQRLKELGIDPKDESDFFFRYLAEGKEAYEDWARPDILEAISLIKKIGGIAVWAHPKWHCHNYEETKAQTLKLQEAGLVGLEVFYPLHNEKQTKNLFRIAKELNLIIVAGSDFHSFKFKKYSKIFAWQDFGLKENFQYFRKRILAIENG